MYYKQKNTFSFDECFKTDLSLINKRSGSNRNYNKDR